MDYAEALSKVFLFRDLGKADLDKLGKVACEYSLPAGATLFNEGDAGDELYVIVLGTTRVIKRNRDGTQEEVATLGSGSYFGEIAFLTDDHRRSATIEMQERCVLLGLHQDDVLRLVSEDAPLGLALYRALARGLARRLIATTQDKAYYKAIALRHNT